MSHPSRIVIATRESELALWQARHIEARVRALHPGIETRLLGMTTEGDRKLDTALSKIGGKGLFVKELEDAGVSDYSIYLDPQTLVLFAFQKVKDHDTSANLPQTAIVKKWWKFMGDIMEANPDNSPVSVNLTEVFHMD